MEQNNKPRNPLAFPVDKDTRFSASMGYDEHLGMPLRDYFAAKAMQAIIQSEGVYNNNGIGSSPSGVLPSEAAVSAFGFADAMLKEREK